MAPLPVEFQLTTFDLQSARVDVGKWLGTAVTLSAGVPDVNMKTITAAIIAAASFAANALDAVWSTAARTITGGTITTNIDKTGYTASTVTDKTGYALSGAGVQAIWDALTSALTTLGSIGKLIVTNVDALISSRSTYAGGAVASVTGAVGSVAAGGITAASFGADAIDATVLAANAATDVAAATLATTVEGSSSLKAMVQDIGAATAGKNTGAGTGTVTFRNVSDTADALVATVDASNNRTVITRTRT